MIKGDFVFDIVGSDVHILWLYNIMDIIYKYNSDASYKPDGGIYLQLITAKDSYIQNITVAEHNSGHSDSFQVKFPNVFTNYPLGAVRVEDQRFKDWDHYKFKIGTNVKINLDGEKDKPDVKFKEVDMVKTKPDVKQKEEPDIKSNKDVKPNIELKHGVKMIRTESGTNKITYEEEKVALILGTTAVFTEWWMFK